MRELVSCCRYAAPDWHTAKLDTELGLTLQFLHHYPPGQSILCGTSSLRLDRVARYLCPGAMGTAAAALAREPGEGPPAGAAEPRRQAPPRRELTADMPDEGLGLYTPPRPAAEPGQRPY